MTVQRPTRKEAGPHYEYEEQHPAYAVIGASRVTSNPGIALFGSDFRHQSFIQISVKTAVMRRGLSSDNVFGNRQRIVELNMSEAQFVSLIATLNVGDGVPCTLEYADGVDVPGIAPDTNRRDQFNAEIAAHLTDVLTTLEGALTTAGSASKTRAAIEHAMQQLRRNLPFVARQFDEHAEKTVERAKAEIAAYVSGRVPQTLPGGQPVLELNSGEEQEA